MVVRKKSLSIPEDQLDAVDAINKARGTKNVSETFQMLVAIGLVSWHHIQEVAKSLRMQKARDTLKEDKDNERLEQKGKKKPSS